MEEDRDPRNSHTEVNGTVETQIRNQFKNFGTFGWRFWKSRRQRRQRVRTPGVDRDGRTYKQVPEDGDVTFGRWKDKIREERLNRPSEGRDT